MNPGGFFLRSSVGCDQKGKHWRRRSGHPNVVGHFRAAAPHLNLIRRTLQHTTTSSRLFNTQYPHATATMSGAARVSGYVAKRAASTATAGAARQDKFLKSGAKRDPELYVCLNSPLRRLGLVNRKNTDSLFFTGPGLNHGRCIRTCWLLFRCDLHPTCLALDCLL
jgi:hypothetical protein